MLRITVELLPYGSETDKQILGMAEIINDLTGDADNGNYQVKIWKLNDKTGRLKLWKKGSVKNFLRQKLTVWHLLSKALGLIKYKEAD